MGEIKSTLDLVMERTKHLQLSDSERREQKATESGKRLRGLIQKRKDNVISDEEFGTEYRQLKSDYDLEDDFGLISECIEQLTLKGDNQAVLKALNSAAGFDQKPIADVIVEFQKRYQGLLDAAERRLTEEYATKLKISGTALTPNPNRDRQWQSETGELETEFRRVLAEVAK